MRIAALAALLVALSSLPAAAQNATVEGAVLRAGSEEPIADAWLTLWRLGPDPKPGPLNTTSDASGRFAFKEVPPGEYSIEAARDGYFSERLWRGEFLVESSAAKDIGLEPGSRLGGVVLSLTPGGSISGKLLDENGQPAVGSPVRLLRRSFDERGRPTYDGFYGGFTSNAISDDRGEYRLFGLPPGEYFVEADFAGSGRMDEAHAWYPNVRDRALAEPVRVRAAETVAGINLTVYLPVPVAGATISGRLGGAVPKNSGPLQALFLRKTGATDLEWTQYANEAANKSGGRFEIRNVPPGVYDVMPEVTDDQDRLYTGRVSVVVGDTDIANLVIPIQPGATLKGRILFNGGPPPPGWAAPTEWEGPWTPDALELNASNVPSFFFHTNHSPRSANTETGEFTISNLPAGTYTLRNNYGLRGNVYIEDVRLNGKSVWDGFEVGAEPVGTVEVLARSPGGTFAGSVKGDGDKLSRNSRIVLVPAPAYRDDPSRYYSDTTEQGTFGMEGIRPGDYHVFVWEFIPRNAWLNADYMRQFEGMGQPIRIHEGDSSDAESVELRIIPGDPR